VRNTSIRNNCYYTTFYKWESRHFSFKK